MKLNLPNHSSDLSYIWKLLIFISIALVLLLYMNISKLSKPFSLHIININLIRDEDNQNKRCKNVYMDAYKLHLSFGKTQPRRLDELHMIDLDRTLPIRNEWIIDQEFREINSGRNAELIIMNKEVTSILKRMLDKSEYNSYGDRSLEKVLRNEGEKLKHTKIGVFGLYEINYEPWIEAILYGLSNSTAHITLMDHQNRVYENSASFKWLSMHDYLVSASPQRFDLVIDYMVGERLGLGRYGEDWSPDADLLTIEQAKCMLKPGGLLVLALSLAKEQDLMQLQGYIIYNSGRVYGDKRLERLTNGWIIKSQHVFNNGGMKIFVLQKDYN